MLEVVVEYIGLIEISGDIGVCYLLLKLLMAGGRVGLLELELLFMLGLLMLGCNCLLYSLLFMQVGLLLYLYFVLGGLRIAFAG
jgi:hypothetical protein